MSVGHTTVFTNRCSRSRHPKFAVLLGGSFPRERYKKAGEFLASMKNTPGEFLESSKRLTPEFLRAKKQGLPHSVFPRRCNPFRMAMGQ